MLMNIGRVGLFWIQTDMDLNPLFDAWKIFASYPGSVVRVFGLACETSDPNSETQLGETIRFVLHNITGIDSIFLPGDLPPCRIADFIDGVSFTAIDLGRVITQTLLQ